MSNEYNSPAQQVARLKDAGLSPALMFGGSGAGASVGASAADMPNAPSGGGAAPSSSMNPSYDSLAASVIKLNSAKAREADANAGKTGAEREYQEWMNNTLAPLIEQSYTLKNQSQEYQNAIAQVNAQYAEIEKLQSLGEQRIRMGEMLANIEKLKSDKALSDREREQLDVIAEEIRSRINVNESQASLNDAKTQTENENRPNIVSKTAAEADSARSAADLSEVKKNEILNHLEIYLRDNGLYGIDTEQKLASLDKLNAESIAYLSGVDLKKGQLDKQTLDIFKDIALFLATKGKYKVLY